MLKIIRQESDSEIVFELQGKLAGPWVEELKACWENRGGAKRTRVHLCAVTFVDEAGKRLLGEMHRRGAALVAEGCMNKAIVDEIVQGERT